MRPRPARPADRLAPRPVGPRRCATTFAASTTGPRARSAGCAHSDDRLSRPTSSTPGKSSTPSSSAAVDLGHARDWIDVAVVQVLLGGLATGATFVHDVFALAIFVVVVGHIFMALTHRDSLRSIFTGSISEKWAARHAARWLKEVAEESPGTD